MEEEQKSSEYFRGWTKADVREFEVTTPRLSPGKAAWVFWLGLGILLLTIEFLPSLDDSILLGAVIRVVFGLLVVTWVWSDGMARGWQADRVLFFVIWAMLIPEIFVPLYLVRSRGWRGAFVSLWRFGLYLLIWMVALVAVFWLAEVLGLPVTLD